MVVIEPGLIITLDNNQEFLVLEIAERDGDRYALLYEIDADEEPVGFPKVAEVIKESEDEFVMFIDDPELEKELLAMFMPILEERFEEMMSDDENP